MTRSNKSTKSTKSTKPINNKPTWKDNPMMRELLMMHTYCRPSGSATEAKFCALYIDNLPGCTIDEAGNRIVTVPMANGAAPRVLWSSHTDTVHRVEGIQKITYGDGIISLPTGSTSSCLGADCTVGVWLMRQMILRGAPGLYIFHAAEEVGGYGSSHIATKTPHVISGIDYAIAFDRRGTTSVITHQGGMRCASDEFGRALAVNLGPEFKLDTGGTFTDTANYTDLIPECTNIGVGYFHQHTADEYQDIAHAFDLLDALCMLAPEINDLPVRRDHTAPKYDGSAWWQDDWSKTTTKTAYRVTDSLEDLVYNNPHAAAAMLEDMGITAEDFEDYLRAVGRH
jgi:hypothetical protein